MTINEMKQAIKMNTAEISQRQSDILTAKPQFSFLKKLYWTLNDETYRMAVVTKYGVIQVKSVTHGGSYVHNSQCKCNSCRGYVIGSMLHTRVPLKKSRFASEKEWKDSLPPGGRITSDIPNDDSDLLPGEVIYI